MKASETKFQPIIEGNKQYVIPLFQRPYSWDKAQWSLLWDDLIDLCQNETPRTHFIGSIVTMPTHSVPEGVAKYLLIDGQQRLTTIFILLILLRDKIKEEGDVKFADKIEQTMLVNHFESGIDYLKLLPTKDDRDSFLALIERQAPIGDESRFYRCYQFFEKKLDNKSELEVTAQSLTKVINSRLSVVSIVLDVDDNPHLVFESLNAKGLKLTQADLIRNYFFMRIHVSEQERIYKTHWEPMQAELVTKDSDNLTEFMRHYMMKNGGRVKENEVYFELKNLVDKQDPLIALKEVAVFAHYYQKILDPSKENQPQLRVALLRLNRLDLTTSYPFLLNCYHDYAQGALSLDDFVEIIKTLENFIVRRFVCNTPTNVLNKIFPNLHKEAASISNSLVKGVKLELHSRGYPNDDEFHRQLMNGSLYAPGERATKTRLILESLELAYRHKEQVVLDEHITIEHVMPQNITEWWKEHLGEDYQIDHEGCLHTLGNLTLTGYNSELSNLSFYHKKPRLVASKFELI